jgi:hypothetical protein
MNELDSARFDPLLILAVARNIGTTLDGATIRAESLVSSLAPNRYFVTHALCLDLFRSLGGYTSWTDGDSTADCERTGSDVPLSLLDKAGEGRRRTYRERRCTRKAWCKGIYFSKCAKHQSLEVTMLCRNCATLTIILSTPS